MRIPHQGGVRLCEGNKRDHRGRTGRLSVLLVVIGHDHDLEPATTTGWLGNPIRVKDLHPSRLPACAWCGIQLSEAVTCASTFRSLSGPYGDSFWSARMAAWVVPDTYAARAPVRQDAICSVKELGKDGVDLVGGQQGGAVTQGR